MKPIYPFKVGPVWDKANRLVNFKVGNKISENDVFRCDKTKTIANLKILLADDKMKMVGWL